jgi:hypothetical protein
LARKKPNRAPLFAFLGVSALVLAGLGWWITGDVTRQAAEDKAAAAIVPKLPAGRMRVVHTSATEVGYLAIDELKPLGGGRVAAVLLRVGRSPNVFDDRASMIVRYETIDCASGQIFEGRIGEFDPAGRMFLVTNGYAGKRGRHPGSEDGEVAVACGQPAESGRVVANARTAQRETQSLPDAYEGFAESHPKDADAWAWLCAAGARGRWRDKTPADCNHAVQLRPDDAGTRLDRGFLFLMLGRKPAADADFRKVAAEDPKNATAIFGHALVLAMNGDETASRKDRARALAMDPDIPAWLERTYRFLISPQYRKA